MDTTDTDVIVREMRRTADLILRQDEKRRGTRLLVDPGKPDGRALTVLLGHPAPVALDFLAALPAAIQIAVERKIPDLLSDVLKGFPSPIGESLRAKTGFALGGNFVPASFARSLLAVATELEGPTPTTEVKAARTRPLHPGGPYSGPARAIHATSRGNSFPQP